MPIQTKKRTTEKLFGNAPKFFTTPVEIGEKTVKFELPVGILSHMEINDGKIHWTVTNGIIQISGLEPQLSIPVMTVPEFKEQ